MTGLKKIELRKKLEKILKEIKVVSKKGIGDISSDEVLKKIYSAMKKSKSTPLSELNVSMFKNGGYMHSDGFIVGRHKNDFILFKGRSSKKIDKKSKNKFKKAIKDFSKKLEESVRNEADLESALMQLPFLELSPFNKEAIMSKFYNQLKNSERLERIVSEYIGKDNGKVLVRDISGMSFGDASYIVSSYEAFRGTPIDDMFKYYSYGGSDLSLSLKRGADTSILAHEELSEDDTKKEIYEIMAKISELSIGKDRYIKELEEAEKKNDPTERAEGMMTATFELSYIQKEADKLLLRIEKAIPSPSGEKLMEVLNEIESSSKTDVGYKEKDIITPLEKIPLEYMMFKSKKETEIANDDKTVKILESIGVNFIDDITIYNYGVFKTQPEEKINKAFDNLVLYAKSIKEISSETLQDKQQKEEIKELQSNDFAI